MNIPLGFAVGTGDVVEIPLKHMAICGQTQEAGKTTALEALITRSGLRAVTFITKRGEGSFAGARRIDPYFREQADWQFVASILEASRGEKLKFERAWIIRASKGARTLADVQQNVRRAMERAKGLSADVYLTLDAYLENVVPQIGRIRWAPRVELAAGVNAMNLTALSTEMMHLVIKSTIDWIAEHAEGTVIVIPEAWRFIPQGRGTPVKLSASAFIRQGAALRNFLWLDSQDLGNIEKEILRSVPVWVLGVQREANEIKRTLENIPASVAKPSKAAIATLGLGQFVACWGKHAVRVYVQPAWLDAGTAREVAISGEIALAIARAPRRKEHTVNDDDARALREENDRLTRENADLRRRLEALEKGQSHVPAGDRTPDSPGAARGSASDRDRDGTHKAHAAGPGDRSSGARDESPRRFTPQETFDNEALYQAIKARLIEELPADPRVLQVIAQRPELRVEVERRVITADGDGLQGRLGVLLSKGFFDEAQTNSTVMNELARTGFSTAPPNVSRALTDLARMGFLTRDNKWYRSVPDMKVNVVERKTA